MNANPVFEPNVLYCLPCIADFKVAQDGPAEPPPIRPAVTMLNGAPHCYEHIAVQRQTGLTLPGAAPIGINRS